MPGFLSEIADDILSIEQDMLGPDYNYAKHIQTPKGLGATSEGTMDALGENLEVAVKYIKLLVEGGGDATIDGKPLGTKFYIKTAGKCCIKPDSKGNCSKANTQRRSMYIDNVPIGYIPFLSSGMGVNFDELRGLVPGIIEDVGGMNPTGLFSAFGQGATPPCTWKENIQHTKNAKGKVLWNVKNDNRNQNCVDWYYTNKYDKKTKKNIKIQGLCKTWQNKSTTKGRPSGGFILDSEIKEYEDTHNRKEAFVIGNEILRGEKKQSKKKLARFANMYVTGFSCLLLYLLHRMINR